MKKKNLIIASIIAGLGFFVLGIECSKAKDKSIAPARIGIVSVKEIFDNCTMKTEIEKNLTDQGDKYFAELKRLEETIESGKVSLNKFKEGSQDYLDTLKDLMMKQSQLGAQREFYQQELGIKEMRNKEDIYRKILEVVAKVAKEKDLDMVLSRDDNYLSQPESPTNPPAQSPTELILTTKTHKLLYFNKDLDITAEVLSAMNSEKKK
ncbi:MAG: OmpH family outer membrane protein [Planctomycetes bacterium]|nr:OmpH family outer membrane protein [Planctomycetota bacterium]MBU1518035.1 OmpH family outer membrane protein [Planctomycetota bacterium]MBU2458207.1 OmpH family outer membrane protein [Planctomycetota bacterium]MBU2596948.1 OmpH family outer membrane protein [Planctomycetota bacterium]